MDSESKVFGNIFSESWDCQHFLPHSLHEDPLPQLEHLPLNLDEAQKHEAESQSKKVKRIETRKGRKRKQKRKYSTDIEINKGHWSIDENKMYHRFL